MPAKMPHRFLGDSGLLVSVLGLGAWMSPGPNHTVEAWFEIVKKAYSHGVNFFDTAENYDNAQADALLGGAIQRGIDEGLWLREDLVVTAKVFAGRKGTFEGGPNDQGLSRKHIVEGFKRSLKELGLDYVDVAFAHRPEKFTPIEETVRAMNFVIDQGWAFYWGTSEWSSAAIHEACAIADRLGLVRPIVEQPQYNILERSKVEFEYSDLIQMRKLGLTVWSPLASGILTGKYNTGMPEGARLANPHFRAFKPDFDQQVAVARELAPIADKTGCSFAQLAIAWCLSNRSVSTVLLNARVPEQLDETLAAVEFVDRITPEVRADIDAVVKFVPKIPEPTLYYTLRERHLEGASTELPGWAHAFSDEKEQE